VEIKQEMELYGIKAKEIVPYRESDGPLHMSDLKYMEM